MRTTRRLRLHRETLRRLDVRQLGQVGGGFEIDGDYFDIEPAPRSNAWTAGSAELVPVAVCGGDGVVG